LKFWSLWNLSQQASYIYSLGNCYWNCLICFVPLVALEKP
jgi:hypothetical protein